MPVRDTDIFRYKGKELFCEDVSVKEIAESIGTPVYLYSSRALESRVRDFNSALLDVPHVLCYSVKANSNLSILKGLFSMGCGADVVSGGELFRALQAGANPKKIVFSGVGKTAAEMKMALDAGILMFNVESSQELNLLNDTAGKMGEKAPIALRVNPDIHANTHPYIATGLKENKFGIPTKFAMKEYLTARSLRNINVVGIDCHIGSQITILSPFISALRTMKGLLKDLRKEGFELQWLDVGGGLGIQYNNEIAPTPREYAGALLKELGDVDISLILEPGRSIVGAAGILVSRVLYTKYTYNKKFVIVDVGMNDLLRPSLYNAFQEIVPVHKNSTKTITADVVGPICESTDFIAKGRKIVEVAQGQLIAVKNAGAYGFSMSSNYNSRPRAAEVLVRGKKYFQIRRRESYEDLICGETPKGA